ncbi:MAG TPA: EAL domain-containing protein [Candidatus Limnocylindrales bacterium]|nr:EAL domain-containing protein [Candidatus Limnocylindrales bacterium]
MQLSAGGQGPTLTSGPTVGALPPPAPAPEALRLVRLRLGLTMLAMAVVPLVLVLLVLPALAGPDRDAQARLSASSADVSAALAADLGRLRSAVLITAADPQVAAALGHSGGAPAALRSSLGSTLALLEPLVSSASLEATDGSERLHLRGGKVVAPRAAKANDPLLARAITAKPGTVERTGPVRAASGGTTMTLSASVRARPDGPLLGLVRFDVSVDALLRGAESTATAAGGYALIVDRDSGSVLADGRPAGAAAVPGGDSTAAGSAPSAGAGEQAASRVAGLGAALDEALQRAGRAWATLFGDGWGVGLAPVSVAVPGFADWTVVVAQPTPTDGVPPQLLLAALAVLAAILALAVWMARQVVRPAADLAKSRHELAALYEVARRDALIDPLTGLGNHRAFQETLGRELEDARRHRYPVALLLLDLDDFKQVNDRSGHASGDAVLSRFGSLLTGGVRRTDAAFRIGGDEFAVVMPHADADAATLVARRLLGTALEPAAGTAGRWAPISFSAGLAAAPEHGTVAGELSARADAALYWGKRHGRTTVEVYDPERHRAELPGFVEDAGTAVATVIERRLLRAVFQPIIRLADGVVIGFEGLIRPLPESGFGDPGSLFAAAAAAGRTVDLDRQCIETVAAAAGRLPEGRFLGLNLSPRSLEAPEFSPGAIRATLARFGLTPAQVILEVTEREPVEALDRLQANLAACRSIGFRIAADDVGAGNAGLRLLSSVRFDMVKIDLALVHAGAMRDPALSVLRSLVEMAGDWGALVVAEGIEDGAQLRAMRELQVGAGQGYLLGRPGDELRDDGPVDLTVLQDEGVWPPPSAFRSWQVSRAGALSAGRRPSA